MIRCESLSKVDVKLIDDDSESKRTLNQRATVFPSIQLVDLIDLFTLIAVDGSVAR